MAEQVQKAQSSHCSNSKAHFHHHAPEAQLILRPGTGEPSKTSVQTAL